MDCTEYVLEGRKIMADWKAHEPFTVTGDFIDAWVLVYHNTPVCLDCFDQIKQGDTVVWRTGGKKKMLVHAEHAEGDA